MWEPRVVEAVDELDFDIQVEGRLAVGSVEETSFRAPVTLETDVEGVLDGLDGAFSIPKEFGWVG
jgi:hypothetical protein